MIRRLAEWLRRKLEYEELDGMRAEVVRAVVRMVLWPSCNRS